MESIRRCEDCRRVIHGEAGNACPYCGGASLNRMEEHRGSGVRLHAHVFRLTFAFCLSLAAMQIAAYWAGMSSPSSGHAGPLWHLNLLVGASVALYWSLRRIEGDFRAFFFVAFGLFVVSEGMSAMAHAYGIGGLRALSGVFRHALLVFSSLALTAGSTDTDDHSRHERILFMACGAFLSLAVLHLAVEFLRIENDSIEDIATAGASFAVAAFAGFVLFHDKMKTEPDAQ